MGKRSVTAKKTPNVSQPVYEVKPYFYLAFGLWAIYVSDNLLIMLVAWAIYTGGAVIFALRSDARRANRKDWDRQKRFINWHEDIYESIPFFHLGAGVLLVKYAAYPLMFWSGLVITLYGLTILGIRVIKRKISWVQEWQRYHAAGAREGSVAYQSTPKAGRLVYCDRCISKTECRGSGLTDKSNVAIMKWLQGRECDRSLQQLRHTLNRLERREVEESRLRLVVAKLRVYQDNCLAWGIRGVGRKRSKNELDTLMD